MKTFNPPDKFVYKFFITCAVIVATLFSGFTAYAAANPGAAASNAPVGASAVDHSSKMSRVDFQNAMRKLWEEHVTWTRLFIVSASAGLPDLDATTQRLLQNQVDIGNAIKPFYGEQAGEQLTSLLREHILLAADLVTAAKAGDSAKAAEVSQKWYQNANDIAAFLHAANPKNWPLEDLQQMMKMHLDLTLQEATDHLQGNYTADVADYDRVEIEILGMADMLSSGIIDQFPSKFN